MLQEQESELGKGLLSDLLRLNSEDAINNIIQVFGEDDLDDMDIAWTFYYSCLPFHVCISCSSHQSQMFYCFCARYIHVCLCSPHSILDLSDISYWFTYIMNSALVSAYILIQMFCYTESSLCKSTANERPPWKCDCHKCCSLFPQHYCFFNICSTCTYIQHKYLIQRLPLSFTSEAPVHCEHHILWMEETTKLTILCMCIVHRYHHLSYIDAFCNMVRRYTR